MGAWGTGLYQDDLAADMKDIYLSLRESEEDSQQIGKILQEEFAFALGDPDDEPVYWLVLGDLQMKLGALSEEVRSQALAIIQENIDLQRWSECSKKDIEKRKQVLAKLEAKLLSPPKKRPAAKRKPYCFRWAIGDVFALPIRCELSQTLNLQGKYFLFHFVEFHRIGFATCRAKITKDSSLPANEEEFNELEYVMLFPGRRVPIPGLVTADLLDIITKSQKELPQDLTYVGNFQNVIPPLPEKIDPVLTVPLFRWDKVEEGLLQLYRKYNLKK